VRATFEVNTSYGTIVIADIEVVAGTAELNGAVHPTAREGFAGFDLEG
jgi:hypothetical protein